MKIQHRHELEEFEECCAECNYSFPSDPLGSEYIICLYDPAFEPYLDDLLERNDYSRCLDLVERKRLALDQAVFGIRTGCLENPNTVILSIRGHRRIVPGMRLFLPMP